MNVRQFRYSEDNLGYLVYGNTTAIAIDGGAVRNIVSFVRYNNLKLACVANTHSHMDHTSGNRALLEQTEAAFIPINTLVRKGTIEIDGEVIRVLHTPGHTADSLCFHLDNILISGDTLFNGKVGRCFTGDSYGFLKSIKTILNLPKETIIYGGHDYVEEYMAFARNLEPDNIYIDTYLAKYRPGHVFASLKDELRVDPFLRFNDERIISVLDRKGLPTRTESDRWKSLLSLM
ncbi:MAG: MBL fold metallo-hydrolase [Thermodesulfobacteriota bacterium]|nr:MBL fold metallo-hydrolase [Thermodesulfobacteriota bacterium]